MKLYMNVWPSILNIHSIYQQAIFSQHSTYFVSMILNQYTRNRHFLNLKQYSISKQNRNSEIMQKSLLPRLSENIDTFQEVDSLLLMKQSSVVKPHKACGQNLRMLLSETEFSSNSWYSFVLETNFTPIPIWVIPVNLIIPWQSFSCSSLSGQESTNMPDIILMKYLCGSSETSVFSKIIGDQRIPSFKLGIQRLHSIVCQWDY